MVRELENCKMPDFEKILIHGLKTEPECTKLIICHFFAYSGGSNSELLKPNAIPIPNLFLFGFRTVRFSNGRFIAIESMEPTIRKPNKKMAALA